MTLDHQAIDGMIFRIQDNADNAVTEMFAKILDKLRDEAQITYGQYVKDNPNLSADWKTDEAIRTWADATAFACLRRALLKRT